MTCRALVILPLLSMSAGAELISADRPTESSANVRTYVFKKTPEGDLTAKVYLPDGWTAGGKRPVILMFYGGGFTGGSPEQFRTKASYLASRGMVAITPEYRVKNRHKTGPEKSIEDARSAIRWTRMNATSLGIDPARLVAAGGSAGASCAALAALSEAFEPAGEDGSVSTKPEALVLYNPALLVPGASDEEAGMTFLAQWHVKKGSPPMIFFFGSEDKWLKGSLEVARRSAALGNRAEVYVAPGQKHGFFNDATSRNGSPGWHEVVLHRTDLFLQSLGYLSGRPTVQPNAALILNKKVLQ